MRVGFTGTQRGMTKKQKTKVRQTLSKLNLKKQITHIHHGDCIGADYQFHLIALDLFDDNVLSVGHLPEDKSKRAFCTFDESKLPKPYLVRNQDIVDETDVMIATPGEHVEQLRSGTWATIRRARKAKKPLYIIYPDGTISKENLK